MSKDSAFTCRRCGHCCQGEGGIILTAPDIRRLCRHLGIDRERFLSQSAEHAGGKYRLKSRDDGYCIFFIEGHGCGVHQARPDICRAWPFFRGNLIDAVSWEMAQDFCPGINGKVSHEEFVRQGLRYLHDQGIGRTSGTPAVDQQNQERVRDADTPEALVLDRIAAAPSVSAPQGTIPHAD